MTDFLTAKDLQTILQVDRTTIYRMAEGGRLPAVKVGGQWRFPRQQIEHWLNQNQTVNGGASAHDPAATSLPADVMPLECMQLIQDNFADLLGVMILLTDMNGQLLTEPSNPCGFFSAADASPAARQRCVAFWERIASDPALTPRFVESDLGLLCARGLVRVGSEIKAMLVVGGIAPQQWPPSDAALMQMAAALTLPVADLRAHVHEVHRLNQAEQERALAFVQRIADIFAHILKERLELAGRLQRIADISRW